MEIYTWLIIFSIVIIISLLYYLKQNNENKQKQKIDSGNIKKEKNFKQS